MTNNFSFSFYITRLIDSRVIMEGCLNGQGAELSRLHVGSNPAPSTH